VQALRRAHANLEAHPQSASIGMSIDELLNRRIIARRQRTAGCGIGALRSTLDADGHEVNVAKRVLQARLAARRRQRPGVITGRRASDSMGNHDLLIPATTRVRVARLEK